MKALSNNGKITIYQSVPDSFTSSIGTVMGGGKNMVYMIVIILMVITLIYIIYQVVLSLIRLTKYIIIQKQIKLLLKL